MAIYKLKDDQGKLYQIEGPDDATDQELISTMEAHQAGAQAAPEEPSMLNKAVAISNKINAFTPTGLMEQGAQKVQQGADYLGEKAATGLASHGVNPYVSAGVGTAVQMAPYLMGAFLGQEPARKEGISLASKLKGRNIGEEVSAAKRMIGETAGKFSQKETMLKGLLKEQGPAINAAQQKAGIAMESIALPEKDAATFANTMKGFASKTPDQLLEAMPTKELQRLKDIAKATVTKEKTPTNAFIHQGIEKIDAAISKAHPEVGEELANFRRIKDSLGSLKPEAKAQTQHLKLALQKLTEESKKANQTGATKKTLKTALNYIVRGAAIGLGYKLIK